MKNIFLNITPPTEKPFHYASNEKNLFIIIGFIVAIIALALIISAIMRKAKKKKEKSEKMYCNNCGNKIDEDSKFCSECGTKIKKDKEIENDEEDYTKKAGRLGDIGCGTFIILTIVFIGIILLIGWGVTSYFDTQSSNTANSKGYTFNTTEKSKESIIQQILTRDANNNDIEIDAEMDLSNLGMKITIHPNCDIEGLVIKIKQYDQDGALLETFKKNLGNVKEGVEVTTSISLADFDFLDIFKLGKTKIEVYDGTVKYLQ